MISGCSGGGKSTLLAELARRGYATVAEPGRRIIADVRAGRGGALPWDDPAAFARCAIAMSVADYELASGLTFFDRGVVDAAVALEAATAESGSAWVARYRYDSVFIAPPWPEIYETDTDRRHSLDKALSDYVRVERAYRDAGYDAVILPRTTVAERADFVLADLGRSRSG
ncbi:AAA family ATPase [Sphingomonas sp.]|jgi:predicted ATPase|uniref:AAA family ATPase n=1 Tax=Sphingomonas sp. TaxID=28214 RepID=UPI002E2EC7F1|nr:AAA family ATPase [Sphingomonas sp.]HEX4695732.1 AAA family ATPase [Sphingomonas sp.]